MLGCWPRPVFYQTNNFLWFGRDGTNEGRDELMIIPILRIYVMEWLDNQFKDCLKSVILAAAFPTSHLLLSTWQIFTRFSNMRFLDSSVFLLLTIWGLRIDGLSASTDSLLEGTFDDTFSNDDTSYVTIPDVGDDQLLTEKGNFDNLAFVVPDLDEGLPMNENGGISSCGGFSADDSFQGECLNLIFDGDFVQAYFLRTRDNCQLNLLFDSLSYRLSRRCVCRRQQSLVFGFFAWRFFLELRIPCTIRRFERR